MILVELSKLLKDGKIDRHASRLSQFLQLADAVFDEAPLQITAPSVRMSIRVKTTRKSGTVTKWQSILPDLAQKQGE